MDIVTTKYGICNDCLQQIISQDGQLTDDTPLFFKAMVQHPKHEIDKCSFHYILDVDNPPMFLTNFSYKNAYSVFCRYYINGFIAREDFKYFAKALHKIFKKKY